MAIITCRAPPAGGEGRELSLRSGKRTRQTDWLFDRARHENRAELLSRIAFQRVATHGAMSTSGEVVPRGTGLNPRRTCVDRRYRVAAREKSSLSPRTRLRDVCFLNRASCFACRRPATASGSRDTRVAMSLRRSRTHGHALPAPSVPDDHRRAGSRRAREPPAVSRRARSVAPRGLRVDEAGRARSASRRARSASRGVSEVSASERRRGLVGRRRRRADDEFVVRLLARRTRRMTWRPSRKSWSANPSIRRLVKIDVES